MGCQVSKVNQHVDVLIKISRRYLMVSRYVSYIRGTENDAAVRILWNIKSMYTIIITWKSLCFSKESKFKIIHFCTDTCVFPAIANFSQISYLLLVSRVSLLSSNLNVNKMLRISQQGPEDWHLDLDWVTIEEFCNPTQIARFRWPTWGPLGNCRPQAGPILAPWTLLPGHWY